MDQEVKSTCCYCGVGCGVLIRTDGLRILGVRGDPEHPANRGRLCTKGATLDLAADASGRLLQPEWRSIRGQPGQMVDWPEALSRAAERFADIIRRDGPDAVAFYISGQLLTEDYYVFNKLAKGLIGTNNIDTNSRLCMSSAVAGYKQTLGADAPPCCYEDIGLARTLFIAGANPAIAHPVVFRQIEDARAANPDLKIIVVDPRRTETAEIADLHLPIRPGTDIALFNGMLHVMQAERWLDDEFIAQHTQGFTELAAIIADDTPARVAELCGVPIADIIQAARWFARQGPTLSLYCQGLNQSAQGTHNNAALIHLHLASGHIGKPGSGPFSLTGQPNAMGGREVGGLANLLSAHRDLSNPVHRAEVAQLWGVSKVPDAPGKSAVDLFQALKTGQVKAVWIACTNPAHSLPNQALVRAALANAEFVVLQEAFADTETAAYADLLLPATTWGEKQGTVTNSERRITRLRPAVPAPGLARDDWRIAVDFALALGRALGQQDLAQRLFPHASVEAVFNEHRETTRGRDLDITGLSYELLEREGPQQWPYPSGASQGQARLYQEGRFATPDGRARFVPVRHLGRAEPVTVDHPISLISGRMRDQWHGMSRTGSIPRLFNLEDEPVLTMHRCDMRQRGLNDGDIVRVAGQRGQLTARVAAQDGLRKGTAWLPMHWGSRFMNSPGANAVASDVLDPYSLQPELKHAAVEIQRLELTWPVVAIRCCHERSEALALLAEVRRLLPSYPHATISLYGGSRPLVVFRGALAEAPEATRLAELDQLFGLHPAAQCIEFFDAGRQISKRALTQEGKLNAVRLSGEVAAVDWLRPAMAEGELAASLLRHALAPSRQAPVAVSPRRIVCKCADVSDRQIHEALAAGADLAALRDNLKCGSFCGGCLPEVRTMTLEFSASQPQAA